jgi:phosphatidylethanolamine-binding protein (PEBP) family uncharacterized protein
MRRPLAALSTAMILSALALAGCGSSQPSATHLARVHFGSNALTSTSIPAQYTCKGADISPPLEWGTLPAETGELAIFIVGFTPEPAGRGESASIEWAIAGVSPALHKLAPGQVPEGAHLGVASSGKRRYSMCPKKGTLTHYQFELYALPDSERISPDFTGYAILGALANANSKQRSPELAHGGFAVNYDAPS